MHKMRLAVKVKLPSYMLIKTSNEIGILCVQK